MVLIHKDLEIIFVHQKHLLGLCYLVGVDHSLGSLRIAYCNDPTIGSYNDYHLSPNDIPSGNQRWYDLVYLGYK